MERIETQKKWSNVVFGILFLISLLLFGRIMLPFLMPVLLGGFLVVLFLPLYDRLARFTGNRRALASGITTLSVLLLIVVPLSLIAFFIGREVVTVVEQGREALENPVLRSDLMEKLPSIARSYILPGAEAQRSESAMVAAVTGSATLLRDILSTGTSLLVDVFLMAVAMYYFFIDGRRLYREATRLLPIERRYIDAFAKEFKDVAYAIVYGNTLTAIIQGALGLVGLLIAGVPHAPVWALGMVIVALIPFGGTALVWLPVSVVLLLSGRIAEGVFLLAWGGLVVSTADNFIRPKLCGSRMTMHPLLVFLSMFGGLAVFGMMGLLVGPLIAAMFMAMVRIYRRDFLAPAREAVDRLAQTARTAGT